MTFDWNLLSSMTLVQAYQIFKHMINHNAKITLTLVPLLVRRVHRMSVAGSISFIVRVVYSVIPG